MLPTSDRDGWAASSFPFLGAGLGAGLATVGATSFLGIHFSFSSRMSRVSMQGEWRQGGPPDCQAFHGSVVMHNFSGTTFVHDCSVLFPWGEGPCITTASTGSFVVQT